MAYGYALPRIRASRGRRSLIEILFALPTLWAERRRLAELDDARLADLGLTRKDVLNEAAKAPWDVPAHWLR